MLAPRSRVSALHGTRLNQPLITVIQYDVKKRYSRGMQPHSIMLIVSFDNSKTRAATAIPT
jgi:hypothetical protein